jgi:23S rRNA (pseudouridine1915-N3)-methyltransferase
MRLRVIWTGKTKDAHLRALVDDYVKRLSHFARCEISEFRESPGSEKKVGIGKDSRRITNGLREGSVNVLLDPEGTEWSSEQLAKEIQHWQDGGTKEVSFIVGGPNGVSAELAARANKRWSLSRSRTR